MEKSEQKDQNDSHILTKKEQYATKKARQQKVQEQELRIRELKSWVPWLLVIGGLVLAVYWASTVAKNSEQSRPGEPIPIVSRDHVSIGDEHEPYNSNPPTSGPHAGPAPWGFSEQELLDENVIHNLEHGGIWISYKDLDESAVAILREIASENSASVVVSPRAANDTAVAVASWGRLLKLDTVDKAVIFEFIKRNKNKSPERLAR